MSANGIESTSRVSGELLSNVLWLKAKGLQIEQHVPVGTDQLIFAVFGTPAIAALLWFHLA